MKLFARTLISWTEPRLFQVRTRDRSGWIGRGLLALAIFAAMMIAFAVDARWGKGPRFTILGALGLSSLIGLFLTAMLDAPDLDRTITINDDAIGSLGNAGTTFSVASWPLGAIRLVRLATPEQLGRSFGAMEIVTLRGVEGRVGIPAKLEPARIAQILHDLGVAVELAGWRPRAAEEAPGARPAAMPAASARVESLPESEAGRIMSPRHFGIAAAMALGPFAVAVPGGLGLVGYAAVRLLHFRDAPGLGLLGVAAGGIALLGIGGWFTQRFAELPPTLYLRRVARSVVGMRPEARVDPRDPEAIFVDVIPLANWGRIMVNNASDTGFLRVDGRTRTVLFEGDRERWIIPAASLISVEVETFLPPGAVEGQPTPLVYSVAVIRARVGGDAWEAPVSPAHIEWSPRTNARRAGLAEGLRDRIRAVAPGAAS